MNSEIKRLLPNNISSSSYIFNEACKIFNNNNNNDLSIKSLNESLVKNNIPVFEGKVYDPTINKTINKLKKNENHIIKELSRINSNEKLLKSKSYINLINNNPHNITKDQKKINDKIKSLEKNRNIYMDRLGEVKNRINTLQYNQEKELGIIENNKKMKFNKFIEEYNNKNNTSLIEKKIQKLKEESEKIQLLMKKDLKKQIDKKNNEINNKEKEDKQKREALLKKMHDEEREDIEKRKKKNNEILLKIKKNINKKPKDKKYLYQKKNEKFLSDENNLVKLENIKRKAQMKHIDLNEFSEMRKNYEQIKSKQVLESKLKIENIKKSWVERHKLIPLYINPLSKLITEENNKNKKEEQNKILKIKNLKTMQKNYSKDKIPKPIKKLSDKIIENEKEADSKISRPYLVKSNSYSNIIREKMMIKHKEKENSKNKNLKENLSGNEDLNSEITQKNKSLDKNKREKIIVFDYLKERRKIKELNKQRRKSFVSISHMDYIGTNEIKNLIKNKGIDDGTLKIAKYKLDSIEEKAKQKNILLKHSGGVANKPELGEEVCDLMIDSIQAKLSLIKEIDKNFDKNSKQEKASHENDKNSTNTKQSDISEKSEENNLDED